MLTVNTANTDVVILCGGLGKRLRLVVSAQPKVMANVKNKPFLDILIEYVASFGFKRVILCTGYMAEIIKKHYERKTTLLEIICSEEKIPLGTGGAIKNAQCLIQSDSFLVMNGDSFCSLDFCEFIKFHDAKKAILSMVITKLKDDQNSGIVMIDDTNRVVEFQEKVSGKKGSYSSTGMYLMRKEIFSLMPDESEFSLEYDLFPFLLKKHCYGYYCSDEFLDIGTPESYAKAEGFFARAGKRRGNG